MKYEVRHSSGKRIIVNADNGTSAKKRACKCWGICYSNDWMGAKAMHAKRVKE